MLHVHAFVTAYCLVLRSRSTQPSVLYRKATLLDQSLGSMLDLLNACTKLKGRRRAFSRDSFLI